MTESATKSNRLQAILVLIATVATIVFNLFAALGLVNGVTPAEISNKYLTPVTPADYAFAIWGAIYAGLAVFSIYQFLPSNWAKFDRIRTLYILSCALNCGWIYFWQQDKIAVCFVLILLLAATLFLIDANIRSPNSQGPYWLVQAPFAVYFGWVSAAAIVNLAVFLVSLKVVLTAEAWTAIAVVLLSLTTALGVFIRVKYSNYLYPLAVAWALTAIAVKQSGHTAIVVACALGVIISLIATLSFIVNLPSHSTAQPTPK